MGDGTSGHRIHFFYAYRQGTPDRMAANGWLDNYRRKIGFADAYLDHSDNDKVQHLRTLCNNADKVVVTAIEIPNGSGGVSNQVILGLQAAGYDGDEDDDGIPDFAQGKGRIYATFIDGYGDQSFCGLATRGGGDDTDPLNDRAPEYSMNQCWTGDVVLHELGHNLGAVQNSAPHTTGAAHCIEESDVMCYDDGGPLADGWFENTCPDAWQWKFDCGHKQDSHAHGGNIIGSEDYYDPESPTRYLSSHWNVADSVFLTPPRDP